MNKIGKRKMLIAVLLLSVLAVGLVYATILFTKTLSGNITVTTTVGIETYSDSARTVAISVVNIPSFDKLSTTPVKTGIIYINNTGSTNYDGKYLLVQVTGCPTGITPSWDYSNDNGASFTNIANNVGMIINNADMYAKKYAIKIVITPSGTQAEGTTPISIAVEIATTASG